MDQKLFGAIEAGGTKFVCAAGPAPDEIYQTATFVTEHPNTTLAKVIGFFDAMKNRHGPFSGFGVAAFGPVQVNPDAPDYGSILNTPKPRWPGVSFPAVLSRFGAPVQVESDVSGAGLGELFNGAGRGLHSLAYVTVGTGIGAGIVNDGLPVNGLGHPELGHIRPPRVVDDTYEGFCRFHHDCLEGLACGPAINERWGANLSELGVDHPALDMQAHYLSHLALTLILGHMPERLIFGGGVMKAKGLMEKLRKKTSVLLAGYLQQESLSGDLSDYIVKPALGDAAGVTGAMHLAMRGQVNESGSNQPDHGQ